MAEAPFPGPQAGDRKLILASRSPARQKLLRAAGLDFETAPAAVDEEEVRMSLRAEGAEVEAVADTLAELKAARLSSRYPDAYVVGADQILVCEGEAFDKPPDMAAARQQLLRLQDRSHQLVSAAVVVRGGDRIWGRTEHATLTMRPLDAAFVEGYLEAVGAAALDSVGCYQLEGLGAHLFSRIDGDFFTILGLPLLPLLDFLRANGLVPR